MPFRRLPLALLLAVLSLARPSLAAPPQEPFEAGGGPVPPEGASPAGGAGEAAARRSGGRSAVDQAISDYRETGKAVAVAENGALYLPYGGEIPEIRCATLDLCDVTLEPGEELRDTALGDTKRWLIFVTSYGTPPTPIVTLKPTEGGLRTTLLVTTGRRAYRLRLASLTEAEARKARVDHVRFYYPEETLQSWRLAAEAAKAAAARRQEEVPLAPASLSRLNFDYRIEGARWRPVLAFDDGTQTVLRFSSPPPHQPALLVEIGGETLAVNYRTTPEGWLIDRVFDRARLVVRVGRKEQSAEIVNLHRAGGR